MRGIHPTYERCNIQKNSSILLATYINCITAEKMKKTKYLSLLLTNNSTKTYISTINAIM